MERNSFEVKKRPDKDDGRVHPVFYWKCPPFEEFRHWFGPAADTDFRIDHPIFYIVLNVIMIILLALPVVLYYFALTSVFGQDPGKESIIGWLGSFLIAIALINIAAAWMEQYFGHIVTIVLLVLGAGMIGLSFALLM